MSSRRITAADLETVIGKIMDEYQEEVVKDLKTVTKKVGMAGAKALRSESEAAFGTSNREKPYAKGWGWQDTSTRLAVSGALWNKTNPGLAHLLENGHAIRRGGRIVGEAKGREHIKKVRDEIEEKYVQEVADALSGRQ